MATIIVPNFLTEKVYAGLNTYQYTIQNTGVHNCKIKVNHRETSSLTISIVQAGSVNATLATVTLSPSSGTKGLAQETAVLNVAGNFTSGDTVSFVLTSSASVDQQLNTVKARFTVNLGGLN